jgi:hypothetical protein
MYRLGEATEHNVGEATEHNGKMVGETWQAKRLNEPNIL